MHTVFSLALLRRGSFEQHNNEKRGKETTLKKKHVQIDKILRKSK